MGECQQDEAKLADFISGYADAQSTADVQAHLESCPRCRRTVTAQSAVRQQMRLLAQKDAQRVPPPYLWKRAGASWDARDARRRGGQLRLAAVGACTLVFLLGTAWARLNADREFPVESVMQDFENIKGKMPAARFVTSDADRAARWLRPRLHSDLPPINLSLTRAELLGVDIIATPHGDVGRLIYRAPQGLTALYMMPGRSHFAQAMPLMIENQDFQLRSKNGVSLYGWEAGGVGYGLTNLLPAGSGRSIVINAEHASDQPASGE